MEYTTAKIKNIYVIKFDNNEDLLLSIKKFAKKEKVTSAFFFLVGAVRDLKVVIGPKKLAFPPVPVWERIKDTNEMLGTGSLFMDGKNPKIHLHMSMGSKKALVGCLRTESKISFVVECILFELKTKAKRGIDRQTGMIQLKCK